MNYPFKLKLSHQNFYEKFQIEILNDPILKLLSNFEEVKQILELKEDSFKFLYFNFKIIQKILYDSENIITLDFKCDKFILSRYFYLSLLITYNSNIINFEYSINFIQAINEQKIEENNIKEILKSKILFDLIHNYKQTENYNYEKDHEKLNEIENSCLDKIKNYKLDIFNLELNNSNSLKMDYNNKFLSIKIDKIYINIIKSLIKLKKFYNSFDIIKQLDFESIIITKEMFEEFSIILNDNKDYINDYRIIKIEDLLDEKKINFYYILLKYILKNPFYIYRIPFLLKSRAIILKSIKSNLEQLISLNISNNIKDQFEYLLETMTDSKYYFFKYINNQIKEILNYYHSFIF